MRKVALQDANILIDLLRLNLLDSCLSLPYTFCTTSLIFDELFIQQQEAIRSHIIAKKFEIFNLTEDEVVEILLESNENKRLSEQDWSAIYCARKYSAILITGDNLLRKLAHSKSLPVHGILWLLDEMVNEKILIGETAISLMNQLITFNSRLPINECNNCKVKWSQS